MAYTNTKAMLDRALKGKYMVGAFNVSNLEFVQSVINAGEKANRDVIVGASESAIKYAGAETLVAIVKELAKNVKIDVALHLDHGKDFETAKKCIDAGFSSVMIDYSTHSYEENVRETKKVVEYARKFNVSVEAELGKIVGVEDNAVSKQSNYTDPEEAKRFIAETGVDSLAVSIGTAHGINKSLETPKLQFGIIDRIGKMNKSTPLVCHGASTVERGLTERIVKYGGEIKKAQGIPVSELVKLRTTQICKMNMDTDLRLCYTGCLREYLANNKEVFDPRKILGYARDKMSEYIYEVITKILN